MTRLGIICAMEKEFDLLYGLLFNRKYINKRMFSATTMQDGGKDVLVTLSGIGKVNAAICAKKMIERGVMNIISTGVAGAADINLMIGDIVVGNSYCYHDVWCGEPNKNGQIQGMPAVFPSSFGQWIDKLSSNDSIHLGTIATGDWFVQTKEKMEDIKKYLPDVYNLVAVDMESAAIAQVCYNENVPFMSIRIISDNPLLQNQRQQYEGFWNDVAKKSAEILYNIIK